MLQGTRLESWRSLFEGKIAAVRVGKSSGACVQPVVSKAWSCEKHKPVESKHCRTHEVGHIGGISTTSLLFYAYPSESWHFGNLKLHMFAGSQVAGNRYLHLGISPNSSIAGQYPAEPRILSDCRERKKEL